MNSNNFFYEFVLDNFFIFTLNSYFTFFEDNYSVSKVKEIYGMCC